MRRVGSGDTQYVEIHSSLGRQFVPAWMLDADRCAQLTCGPLPSADLASLIDLTNWLHAIDL